MLRHRSETAIACIEDVLHVFLLHFEKGVGRHGAGAGFLPVIRTKAGVGRAYLWPETLSLTNERHGKKRRREGVRIGLMKTFFRTRARSATSLSPGGRALAMRGFAWPQSTSKRKDNIRKRFSSSGIAKIQGALHTGVFVLVLLPQPLNADLRAHLRAGTSLRLT